MGRGHRVSVSSCLRVTASGRKVLVAYLDNSPFHRVKSPTSRMAKTSDKQVQTKSAGAIDTRMLRTMAIAVGVAVALSSALAPWRVTTGLLLGGLLSLLSHHWMRTSIAAAFSGALEAGTTPKLTSVKYVLRYFVIAVAVLAAYQLDLISLPATIAGLCSFVVALFVEALREFYIVIIRREEIS